MDVVWTEYCHDSIDLLEGSTIEPLLLQVGRGGHRVRSVDI